MIISRTSGVNHILHILLYADVVQRSALARYCLCEAICCVEPTVDRLNVH
jgi:hypothetical protein